MCLQKSILQSTNYDSYMQITYEEQISQDRCHFCAHKRLTQIASVKNAPAFLGCTTQKPAEDLFLSFHLLLCNHCSLIQTDAQPLERTYSELHSEALGPIWRAHHLSFASFIQKQLHLSTDMRVLEIGASSQPIARHLPFEKNSIWYIDPIKTPPFSLNKNEQYLSGFFPEKKPDAKLDLIIASHVLEHIPHTHSFFKAIASQLTENGKLFISIPHFQSWFRHSYFNAISAEHITYPFLNQLLFIARSEGFDMETEYYGDHSLFAVFKRQASHAPPSFPQEDSKKWLVAWIHAFNKMVKTDKITADLSEVFITGASHLSQYFLLCNQGLEERITAVLDNSSKKWGQRLYGTSTVARPFHHLTKYERPTVILTPSPYAEEMRQQIIALNAQATIVDL